MNISFFQRRRVTYTIALLFLVAATIEIWTVNRLSTYGEKISKIEQSKNDLVLENQILQNEIAKRSSLSEVEKYATTLGFEKISQVKFLQDEGLALNH
jgi:hypothetical protein